MTSEIPDKLYFKIGETSKLIGVAPHVLRYWESEFPDIKPKRAGSKQRLYRRQDVEMLLVIRDLLHDRGYTIAGARKLIKQSEHPQDLRTRESETTDPATELSAIKQELIELHNILRKNPLTKP